MTINEMISQLRETLRSRTDDSNYSDQYLYELVKSFRAVLLKQRAEKHKPISKFNYQKFCVELECVSASDCIDCSKDISCNVLRSTKKLPVSIHGRNKDLLRVRLMNGEQVSYVSDYTEFKTLQYSKTRKNKMAYTMTNGYLEIYGNDILKYVVVEGPLSDPTDLVEWTTCGTTNTESCYDIRNDEFPMEESIFPTVRDMIYKELNVSINLMDDTKNDSTTDKQNQI